MNRAIIMLLAGALLGCDAPANHPETAVGEAAAPQAEPEATCEVPGVIGSARVVTLEASTAGRLHFAPGVVLGAAVREGDRLATIHSRDDAGRDEVLAAAWRGARARAATQQAELAVAERKHAELRPLAGVESRSTLAEAHDQVVLAEARHREAKAEVSGAAAARERARRLAELAAMRAPIQGTVVRLAEREDAVVQVGQPVAVIRDDDQRILRFAVDPDAAARLVEGQAVGYERAGDGGRGEATIVMLPASSDPRTGLVVVEARLPADEVAREGTSTHVELPRSVEHWCTRRSRRAASAS